MPADVAFNGSSPDSTQKAYALLRDAALAQVLRHFEPDQDDIASEEDAARFVKGGQLALSRYKKYTESIVDDASLRRVFATLDVIVQKYIYSTWAQDARHDILNTTGHDVVKSLDFRATLNDLVAITVADKLPEEKFIERVAILRGLDHARFDQASQCLIAGVLPMATGQNGTIDTTYRISRRIERMEPSAGFSDPVGNIVRTPTRVEGNSRYILNSRQKGQPGEAPSVDEMGIRYAPNSSASQNTAEESSLERMRIEEHGPPPANSRVQAKSIDRSESRPTHHDDIGGGRPSHSSRKRKIHSYDDHESFESVYTSFPQCVRETWTVARLKSAYGGLKNSWPCAPFKVYSRATQERMCSRCKDVNKVAFCVFHENSHTCIKCKVDKAKCSSTPLRANDTVLDDNIRPRGQDNSGRTSPVSPREKQLKAITVRPLKRLRRASAPPFGTTEVISRSGMSSSPQLHESMGHISEIARTIIVPSVTSPSAQASTQIMLEEVQKERLAIASRISMLFTQLEKLDDVAEVLSPQA